MSVTATTRFRSIRFNRDVYAYRGFVVVPVDATGSRGGDRRFYEIWSNDQRLRYNSKIRTIATAKALIDTGSYPTQQHNGSWMCRRGICTHAEPTTAKEQS